MSSWRSHCDSIWIYLLFSDAIARERSSSRVVSPHLYPKTGRHYLRSRVYFIHVIFYFHLSKCVLKHCFVLSPACDSFCSWFFFFFFSFFAVGISLMRRWIWGTLSPSRVSSPTWRKGSRFSSAPSNFPNWTTMQLSLKARPFSNYEHEGSVHNL